MGEEKIENSLLDSGENKDSIVYINEVFDEIRDGFQ